MLEPDAGGSLDAIQVVPEPQQPLKPGEVRAAIEAFGLNFRDVFIAIGLVDDFMGGEFCGRVLETGDGVSSVAVGDRVVGMTFKNYGSETVTLEKMIVPAPPGFSVTELATIPTAFVSAALSFELSGLNAGDRVLIHAGAGGVGLAAIQLAQAAGAEVFATASARKRDYLALAWRRARLRQPHDGVRRGHPRGHGRRRGRHGAEQPDRRGLHRGEPLVPRTGRPLRGNGPGGHPERGRDGGGPAGRRLRHPHDRRSQGGRACKGRRHPARGDGAARGRRS